MAATDILTIDEARTAVNLGGQSSQDAQLGMFVSGITGRIDDLCGPVVIRTVTDEAHDGGDRRIWLDESPVDSVTTVVEWLSTTSNNLTAETNSSKPASGFLLDHAGNAAYLIRRSSGSDTRFPAGRRNVVVTYEAGRFASTSAVDGKFKLAVASILRRVYKRESAVWSHSPGAFSELDADTPTPSGMFFRALDPMVKEFLGDEVRPPQVA